MPAHDAKFALTIVDSGATRHVFKDKELCTEMKDSDIVLSPASAVGPGISARGVGTASVPARLRCGTLAHVKLSDYIWAPDVCFNLVSVSAMTQHCGSVSFTPRGAQINLSGSRSVLPLRKAGSLFFLETFDGNARGRGHTNSACERIDISDGDTSLAELPSAMALPSELRCSHCGAVHSEPLDPWVQMPFGWVNLHKPHRVHVCSECGLKFRTDVPTLGRVPAKEPSGASGDQALPLQELSPATSTSTLDRAMPLSSADSVAVWHARLGHISPHAVCKMASVAQGMDGLPP